MITNCFSIGNTRNSNFPFKLVKENSTSLLLHWWLKNFCKTNISFMTMGAYWQLYPTSKTLVLYLCIPDGLKKNHPSNISFFEVHVSYVYEHSSLLWEHFFMPLFNNSCYHLRSSDPFLVCSHSQETHSFSFSLF